MTFPRFSRPRIFPLLDDESIGVLEHARHDGIFDDVVAGHVPSHLTSGSFLGNLMKKRARTLSVGLLTLVFGLFLARIGSWQILHGEEYRHLADNNRTRTKVLLPDRGVITDRHGVLLAWNEPRFHLLVIQGLISKNPEERAARFQKVAAALAVPDTDFERRYQDALPTDQTILLADNVSYDAALQFLLQTNVFSEFTVELAAKRAYATNTLPTLSHVLGYMGSVNAEEYDKLRLFGYRRFDSIGVQGIEQYYEQELRGTPGVERTEVDAKGRDLRRLEKTDVIDGKDIVLTIDGALTAAVEHIVADHLQDAQVQRAAVVVSRPQTGEILSLVSYPAYDANVFVDGISQENYAALIHDADAPLFPRATQGEYPSGSTIKPMYAAAALMEHIITPSTTFLSTGGIWLGNRLFPDWRKNGHGFTNVTHAIADSVNTFFYIIGGGDGNTQGLGLERLMQYAGLFGFGAKTGIDIPTEADGFLPSKAWKEATKGEPWYVGDTYNVSIGQGDFLVTPLQMNRATSVFANGGYLVTPHLRQAQTTESKKILPDDVLSVVRDGMHQTITYGSATLLQSLPVSSAGKTGTAQWAIGRAPHTWFTGFAPFENPEICVTVLVEEGATSYFATPIAYDVFAWYFANSPQEILP